MCIKTNKEMKADAIPGGMTANVWGRMTLAEQLEVVNRDYASVTAMLAEADARCVELRKAYESKCEAADKTRDKKARAAARRAATQSRASLDRATDNAIELNEWRMSLERIAITTKANIIAGAISEAESCLGEDAVIELGDHARGFYNAIDDGNVMGILNTARGLSAEVRDAESRMRAEGDARESKGLDADRHYEAGRALELADSIICELFKV